MGVYDISFVAEREDVIVGNGMLVGIEGNQLTVNLVPARKLSLVIRFEGDDVKFSITHHNGSWVLGSNIQMTSHLA